MTTASSSVVLSIPLDQVGLPDNVRAVDHDHVEALAGSIKLRGLLVPVIVRPDGEGYCLVAGFHRFAALRKLGWPEIRAEVHEVDSEGERTDRAIENITRKNLNAYEEAVAVKAAIEQGLSEDGAAQALGWPKARVSARVRLLELPEQAQQMIGAGTIALSAVDQLRAIGQVSPELLDAVIGFIADGNQWAAERLAREPGWVLDSALRHSSKRVFAAHLSHLDSHEVDGLRLGKKAGQLLEEATGLHRQIDRYSYGLPPIRFSEQDVDQARAAGVLIEFERTQPIIVDRSLYRELAKTAIERTVTELREKAAAAAAQKKKAAKREDGTPSDPIAEAKRDRDRQLRELADQAHGVNLDLGASLLNGLAVVDPADIDVARFVVYALLGSDYDHSPYTQSGERIARLAASGIRLVIDEFRSDVTKTRKDGSRGRLRIDYGDPRQPEKPVAWLWKFIDGAKSAGELYGRALVVIAAEQHASRLVVPAGQRTHPTHWSSHNDLARKALAKLAAPHLPASLKALETAVAKAHRAYQQVEQAASRSAAAGPGHVRKRDASDDTTEASENTEGVDGQELAA